MEIAASLPLMPPKRRTSAVPQFCGFFHLLKLAQWTNTQSIFQGIKNCPMGIR